MFLKEFFSRPIEIDQNQKKPTEKLNNNLDDLFWFIIDHDKLHKDYFFPAAKKIKKSKGLSEQEVIELLMPMVVKGCKEYFIQEKMHGKLSKFFPEEMRKEICKKLYDHYFDDIKKDTYKID